MWIGKIQEKAEVLAHWMDKLPDETSVQKMTVQVGDNLITWTYSILLSGEVVIYDQAGGFMAVKASGRWFFRKNRALSPLKNELSHNVANRLRAPVTIVTGNELTRLALYGLAVTVKRKLKGD